MIPDPLNYLVSPTPPPLGTVCIFRRQAPATRYHTFGIQAGSGDCRLAAAVALPNAEPKATPRAPPPRPAFAWFVASAAFIFFWSGLVKPEFGSQTRIGHRPQRANKIKQEQTNKS